FLRRDVREVQPWAETCGQIRPLLEEKDGAAAEVHHLEITDATITTSKAIDEAIIDILTLAAHPMTRGALRDRLRTRNERVGEALDDLERRGLVRRVPGGWGLRSFPFPPKGSQGTERSEGAR
ncbi:MAG: hypothetical protein AAB578_09180, partial [Elusimicrobiota bacterium]